MDLSKSPHRCAACLAGISESENLCERCKGLTQEERVGLRDARYSPLFHVWPETAVMIDAFVEAGRAPHLLDDEWAGVKVKAWKRKVWGEWKRAWRQHGNDEIAERTNVPCDCYSCTDRYWEWVEHAPDIVHEPHTSRSGWRHAVPVFVNMHMHEGREAFMFRGVSLIGHPDAKISLEHIKLLKNFNPRIVIQTMWNVDGNEVEVIQLDEWEDYVEGEGERHEDV